MRYIVSYTITESYIHEKYLDSYQVFESLAEAQKRYADVLKMDNLYTASISIMIEGTDLI